MPVEVAPKSGLEAAVSDAKEFSMQGLGLGIENITPRTQCTAPPNCRGCQRPPCGRSIGEEASLIKK